MEIDDKISSEDLLEKVRETHKEATGIMILKNDMYEVKIVNISSIKLDNGTLQNCDQEKISKYTKDIEKGDKFPLIVIDDECRLIDGYHRITANHLAGYEMVKVYAPI
jgi:hypothetical protein